jgi:hypothetical protein
MVSSCLIVKMEAMRSSSKMSVIACQTAWHSIPEDGTLQVTYFPSCMFVTTILTSLVLFTMRGAKLF